MSIHGTRRLQVYMAFTAFTTALAIIVNQSMLVVSLLLLVVPLVSRFMIQVFHHVLEGVETRIKARIEPGGDAVVEYVIENPSPIPVFPVEYSIQYSELLRLKQGFKSGLMLIPSRGTVKLRLVFHGRLGEHVVGPVKVVLRDPLGLYRSNVVELKGSIVLNIPPGIDEVVVKRLFRYARSTGLTKSRSPGEGVEFYDARDYAPGDEVRRILWRIYASRRKLAVWEAEREVYLPVVFILDSTRNMWSGPIGQSVIEHSARIIASITRYLSSRGYPVAVTVFNESVIHASGKPKHGYRGFIEVIKTLSKASLSAGDALYRRRSLATALTQVYSMVLPRDRSIVFLFTHIDDEVLDEIAKWNAVYQEKGHVLYVIHPLITTYERDVDMSEWAASIYRIKLVDTLRKDLETVSRARRMGIRIIAVTPGLIPQRVVDTVDRYSAS